MQFGKSDAGSECKGYGGRGVKLQPNGYEWEINNLLYAVDAVLIADSAQRL